MPRLIAISAILIFLILSVGSSLTHRPQIDEGMFASPAYNLATHGHFGTTVLEKERSTLTRIEERTYWVMPLFLLTTSASFKVLGFSLFNMRLVSVLWGLVLIAAIYFIALKISGSDIAAVFALVLGACDYMVLETASSARMDMMSAALGFAAIATYLVLRERNLMLAVLLSQCLIVIDGLTHPNAIMAFVGLIFLTLFYDRRRLNLRIVAAAALPYLVGGAAFGLWVLQDPTAFKDQFIDNALMGGRMSGMSSPLANLTREFTERYPHAFGLGVSSSGHSGPIYLKSLIMVGYIAGLLGFVLIKDIRNNRNYRALMIVTVIYFVMLSLIDGQKQTTYLIHIVPLFVVFMAATLGYFWEKRLLPRFVLAAAALAAVIVPVGGMALKIRQNTRGNFYDPMIAHLKLNSNQNDVVMGGAELAFGLGFDSNLIADGRFAYYTGKRPRYIVYDSAVENSLQSSRTTFPEFYEYLPRLLSEEYEIAYENAAFKVYERRTAPERTIPAD
jgi:4-amino-4-deoxy-L-arabinose transferase-like glycosyltransferase